jgi:hypothetical protein
MALEVGGVVAVTGAGAGAEGWEEGWEVLGVEIVWVD